MTLKKRKKKETKEKNPPNSTAIFNFESENVEIKHFDTFWN